MWQSRQLLELDEDAGGGGQGGEEKCFKAHARVRANVKRFHDSMSV